MARVDASSPQGLRPDPEFSNLATGVRDAYEAARLAHLERPAALNAHPNVNSNQPPKDGEYESVLAELETLLTDEKVKIDHQFLKLSFGPRSPSTDELAALLYNEQSYLEHLLSHARCPQEIVSYPRFVKNLEQMPSESKKDREAIVDYILSPCKKPPPK
jgi:hypothetical protein